MGLCKRCLPEGSGLDKSKRWEEPETCDRCGQEPVYENKNPYNTTWNDCVETAKRIVDGVLP